MSAHVSQSEFARRCKVSRQWISQAVAEGRIPVRADGRIELKAGRRALKESTAPRTQRNPAFIEARTKRELIRAKMDQLEYDVATGKLLDRESALRRLEQMLANVRARMRGLPRSLAPLLGVQRDPGECERIMLAAIDRALLSLSEDIFGEKTPRR